MANYFRNLDVGSSQEGAFEYVADFTHAVWDPATLTCEKVTDGPIGVGTTFMLKAKFLTGIMKLPYKITEANPILTCLHESGSVGQVIDSLVTHMELN